MKYSILDIALAAMKNLSITDGYLTVLPGKLLPFLFFKLSSYYQSIIVLFII